MYELGIMAYDVAVIRSIVVALERYMSRPWLIEKIQILVWYKYLYRSMINDLNVSLYGYRIRYFVEFDASYLGSFQQPFLVYIAIINSNISSSHTQRESGKTASL